METGYVLDFTDRTFRDFFADFNIDIDNQIFRSDGTSKANRMRTFWKIETNQKVGKVLNALIEYLLEEKNIENEPTLVQECQKISGRLLGVSPVQEIHSIILENPDDRDFEIISKEIRDIIEKNKPEVGLDRLHTYLIKFVRKICIPYGIDTNHDKPLHGLFGEYVKALRSSGQFESEMAEMILKSSISVLEKFNHVRNNQSLAHDNPILGYEESLLIFNHITALVRFIKAIDRKYFSSVAKPATFKAPWQV